MLAHNLSLYKHTVFQVTPVGTDILINEVDILLYTTVTYCITVTQGLLFFSTYLDFQLPKGNHSLVSFPSGVEKLISKRKASNS